MKNITTKLKPLELPTTNQALEAFNMQSIPNRDECFDELQWTAFYKSVISVYINTN